ncbi:MAG: hypothetical protein LUM44_10010 [Pyrinomonadaceae bacterium]|nr:hypothetical protein [Pyrinomonadaceae bacterium]
MSYFDFSDLFVPEPRLTNSVGEAAIKRAQENFHLKTGYKLPDKKVQVREIAEKPVRTRPRIQQINNQFSF